MRERVEDLGRIAVMIENLLEDEFFDRYCHRPKDFFYLFQLESDDEKESLIRHFAYGRETVSNRLNDMLSIALGEDNLNTPDA